MQTFLPYRDFARSVAALDSKRLGKQRLEVMQLLGSGGWVNHPARRMWDGYRDALITYGLAACDEWIKRGYKDTLWGEFQVLLSDDPVIMPSWLGSFRFHSSHRGNLLRKDWNYYNGSHKWTGMSDVYFWPAADYDWRMSPDDREDVL